MSTGENQGSRQSPSVDPEVLIKQLRDALPGGSGSNSGSWKMVRFNFSAGTPKEGDPKDKPPGDEPKPQDAPIRPGGPRIEAAYEWIESC